MRAARKELLERESNSYGDAGGERQTAKKEGT
jgi:hypothetical protein